jgi:2-iminobutanoate/2-iminopropanoate deaminase
LGYNSSDNHAKEAIMTEVIKTDQAPAAQGPYSQGICAGGLVFTAGQAGLDPATGKLVGGGIVAETRRALTNLKGIVEAAGSSMDKAVKVTVYLQNVSDFAAMNAVYADFFGAMPPARSTVEVAALPLGALVEIDVVAAL